MKHHIAISLIAFAIVGACALLGASEAAGLFGAIIGVGYYIVEMKDKHE